MPKYVSDDERARALEVVAANPGATYRDLAAMTGVSVSTLQRWTRAPAPAPAVHVQQPIGTEEHKAAAKTLGLHRVDDLVVLKRDNDPFYTGTPRDQRLARWFAGLWNAYGRPGWHLRRVHYVATQSGALKPNGDPYLDKDPQGWSDLSEGSQAARNLGLVDPELFIDKRTEAVSQNVFACEDSEPAAEIGGLYGLVVPDIALPGPDLALPEVTVSGYEYGADDQPALLEIWVEKSTVDDVLVPLCRELDVNLKVGKGFESITNAIALLRRAEQFGHRRAHVFYVSDLDHKGRAMPLVLARFCQFWAYMLDIDVHISLERLALTSAQVAQYGLPQAPDSEDTELDALEALHPGALARLVRNAVRPWRDHGLYGRLQDASDEAEDQASQEWADATEDLAAEVDDLNEEYGEIIDEIRPLIQQANARLADIRARAADVARRVSHAAEDFLPDLPDRPEAEAPEVDTSGMLYDSERHWLDQLAAYRKAKAAA